MTHLSDIQRLREEDLMSEEKAMNLLVNKITEEDMLSEKYRHESFCGATIDELLVLQLAVAIAWKKDGGGPILRKWNERIVQAMKDLEFESNDLPY